MPRDEKEVKPKKEKKEKKEAKESKDESIKPKEKKEKPSSSQVPPKQRGPPQKKDEGNSYLDGMDLPSSGSDEEEHEKSARVGASDELSSAVALGVIDAREAKKIADKERIAMEKAFALKLEALKDDDDVFDVAFEGQGDESATVSATDVKVHNLTIRAKGKLLLESTSLTITAGRRYGLVGPNGKGKSTLLRLLAKRQIPVPETLDVLLVEQEIVGDERTALEAVVAADVELMGLRKEEKELNDKLQDPDLLTADPGFDIEASQARLNEVYERMNQIAGSTAESRASKILHGLGFTDVMQRRSTQSFSGGWRMRISLARALYIQPTLLLLDEPTNHLDLRAVLWLEEYLQRCDPNNSL